MPPVIIESLPSTLGSTWTSYGSVETEGAVCLYNVSGVSRQFILNDDDIPDAFIIGMMELENGEETDLDFDQHDADDAV